MQAAGTHLTLVHKFSPQNFLQSIPSIPTRPVLVDLGFFFSDSLKVTVCFLLHSKIQLLVLSCSSCIWLLCCHSQVKPGKCGVTVRLERHKETQAELTVLINMMNLLWGQALGPFRSLGQERQLVLGFITQAKPVYPSLPHAADTHQHLRDAQRKCSSEEL